MYTGHRNSYSYGTGQLHSVWIDWTLTKLWHGCKLKVCSAEQRGQPVKRKLYYTLFLFVSRTHKRASPSQKSYVTYFDTGNVPIYKRRFMFFTKLFYKTGVHCGPWMNYSELESVKEVQELKKRNVLKKCETSFSILISISIVTFFKFLSQNCWKRGVFEWQQTSLEFLKRILHFHVYFKNIYYYYFLVFYIDDASFD